MAITSKATSFIAALSFGFASWVVTDAATVARAAGSSTADNIKQIIEIRDLLIKANADNIDILSNFSMNQVTVIRGAICFDIDNINEDISDHISKIVDSYNLINLQPEDTSLKTLEMMPREYADLSQSSWDGATPLRGEIASFLIQYPEKPPLRRILADETPSSTTKTCSPYAKIMQSPVAVAELYNRLNATSSFALEYCQRLL